MLWSLNPKKSEEQVIDGGWIMHTEESAAGKAILARTPTRFISVFGYATSFLHHARHDIKVAAFATNSYRCASANPVGVNYGQLPDGFPLPEQLGCTTTMRQSVFPLVDGIHSRVS